MSLMKLQDVRTGSVQCLQTLNVEFRGPDSLIVWKRNSSSLNGLHFPNKPIDFENAAVRRLISEAADVFCDLQKRAKPRALSAEELLEVSSRYRSIIRCCCLSLQHAQEDSLAKMFHEKDMLNLAEKIGRGRKNHEFEHRLLKRRASLDFLADSKVSSLYWFKKVGSAVQELITWSRWHFNKADEWLKDVRETIDDQKRPEAHPKFWDAVLLFVLFGRVQEARQLLSVHSRKTDSAFVSVDELLRKIPLQQENVTATDASLWYLWQQEARRRFEEGHYVMFPQLETLARIISGDETIFANVKGLFSTWFELLVSRVLYLHPSAKVFDLQHFIPECVKMFPTTGKLDEIICAVLEFDVLKVIKDISSYYKNWWFSGHLADLLFHCGSVELGEVNGATDLREYLLLDYAAGLMSHRSLWEVAILYLDHCPVFGRECLKLYLEQQYIHSDRKAAKLIAHCHKRDLPEVARGICRRLAVNALKKGALATALSWCIEAKDPLLAGFVAEQYLAEYGKTGLLHSLHLLDNLGDAILINPSLAFLGKYREFHRLYEEGDFKSAANTLLALLTSKIAPKKFWRILLIDAMPFLDAADSSITKVIFDVEQTFKLMEIVESIVTETEVLQSTSYLQNDEVPENLLGELQRYRLHLAKNLSKAIVHA